MHISLAFLNPGDEVLIPDPGYQLIHQLQILLVQNQHILI